MQKNWKVDGRSTKFPTYEEALNMAKRNAATNGSEPYGVYELVSFAQAKIPDVDVVTVTA